MSTGRICCTLAVLAILLAAAPVAHAVGINLSWNDCGAAGAENQSFACNTNTGAAFVLVLSAVPPVGSTAITGTEISLDFNAASPTLPDWWKFKNTGWCRQTALLASTDFTSWDPPSCADYWMGQAAGGISAYLQPYAAYPCVARLLMVFAVVPSLAGPLDENLEYYICRVSILRSKTVGTGSCDGCTTPVMVMLNEVKLTQPVGVGDYRIQNPVDRNWATWQHSNFNVCRWVPTRTHTWGGIKSLYR